MALSSLPQIVDKTKEAGFGTRFGALAPVEGIIIHHTAGGGDVNGVIQTFKERGLPAQYVIDQDGTIFRTLPDGARGQQIVGSEAGATRMGLNNANTIGIEIIGANDAAWTPAQLAAAKSLVGGLTTEYGIDPSTSVWGHSEINPRSRTNEGANLAQAIRSGGAYAAPAAERPYAGNPFGVTGAAPVTPATPPPLPRERPAMPAGAGYGTEPQPQPREGVPKTPNLRPANVEAVAERIDSGDRLTKGSSGQDVRELQRFLNSVGATDAKGRPLKEDGIFGNLTREAVKDFQREHPELVPDGIVGPRTVAVMMQEAETQQRAATNAVAGAAPEGAVPQLLTPLANADPISADLAGEAARVATAAEIYARTFAPGSRAAANIGTQMAEYAASPAAYIATLPRAGQDPAWGGQPSVGSFRLHPGEQPRQDGAARTAWSALTQGRDTVADPFRSSSSFRLGADTAARETEYLYNGISAYARRLVDGPPPSWRADESPPEAAPTFIPVAGAEDTPAPPATGQTPGWQVGGEGPADPNAPGWQVGGEGPSDPTAPGWQTGGTGTTDPTAPGWQVGGTGATDPSAPQWQVGGEPTLTSADASALVNPPPLPDPNQEFEDTYYNY